MSLKLLLVDSATGTESLLSTLSASFLNLSASGVANDSSVSGNSVADALNTLSSSLMTLSASSIVNDSNVSGSTVKDTLNTLDGLVSLQANRRILVSDLADVNGQDYRPGSGVAYWVYLGFVEKSITIKKIRLFVQSAGSGAQTAEVGLASTPTAPNGGDQTLTKIYGASVVSDLTTGGGTVKTETLNQVIAARTHLWAGVRTAMASTQPLFRGFVLAWNDGRVLEVDAGGALTGTGPWSGIAATADSASPQVAAGLD